MAWRVAAGLGLLALAGCGGAGGCGPVELANRSGRAIEQVYAGAPGGAWGDDLLAPSGLVAPGATLPLTFPGRAPHALRVVWDDGRAVEMAGFDGCPLRRIVATDDRLQAE